jgi:hypothetical protein
VDCGLYISFFNTIFRSWIIFGPIFELSNHLPFLCCCPSFFGCFSTNTTKKQSFKSYPDNFHDINRILHAIYGVYKCDVGKWFLKAIKNNEKKQCDFNSEMHCFFQKAGYNPNKDNLYATNTFRQTHLGLLPIICCFSTNTTKKQSFKSYPDNFHDINRILHSIYGVYKCDVGKWFLNCDPIYIQKNFRILNYHEYEVLIHQI